MTQAAHDEVEAILAACKSGVAEGKPPHAGRLPSRRSYYRRARSRRGWMMSLNLTPMIDTVFNLLFFFMIVSRFGAIEGLLPARLPSQTAAAAAASTAINVPRLPLRIQLEADAAHPDRCQYRIDRLVDHPAPIRELPARLAQIREREPGFGGDTAVYLVAGDSVAWDHVVNAYNAALSARYEKIYFAGAK